MGNGRKAIAPCGHPGECVIGTFVTCDQGCDAVPRHVDPEETPRLTFVDLFDDDLLSCPKCFSEDVEPFPLNGQPLLHCVGCGHVFQ